MKSHEKRKPDFVSPMQGEREVLEIYGWPLPKEKPAKSPYISDKAVDGFTRVVDTTELKGKLRSE